MTTPREISPPFEVRDLKEELEFVYDQATGSIHLADAQDVRAFVARGYSGARGSVNNPDHEDRRAVGPIPRGMWRLFPAVQHPRLGSFAIRLEPEGHTAKGRSEFFIHGDNSRRDNSASRGCIIAGPRTRQLISAMVSTGIVRRLVVV